MNSAVSTLFQRLEAPGEDSQKEAALELAMLIERSRSPSPDDSVHRLILPEALLQLDLSNEEADEIVERICSEVLSERLSQNAKISLISALGKIPRLNCFEAILRFLTKQFELLDDEGVYAVLVSIVPAHLAGDERDRVIGLLKEHRVESVLDRLAQRGSDRLADPVRRLRQQIQKLSSHT